MNKRLQPSAVPENTAVPVLIPARMLNEYAYCPRLAYLEWVQGEFADNAYTEDGREQHRRVDGREDPLPEADGNGSVPRVSRSVLLSAEGIGLVARIDLVETLGDQAVPVDYKRGSPPDVPDRAYEPERVQLCAQGLILRENGFNCEYGLIYFTEAKTRVKVLFDKALVARCLELAIAFRCAAAAGKLPPPLEESPKCNGCSLVGICLPDETALLMEACDATRTEPRRLIPVRDDAMPVYVQTQGAYVSKHGDLLVIKNKGKKVAEAKLFETSQLTVMGNAQVTTQTVQELCRRGVPIVYTSSGGWFYGMTTGAVHKNVELRLHQYSKAEDPAFCLALSRRLVATKIRNCRTLLRRNAEGLEKHTLHRLKEAATSAEKAETLDELLGMEGASARVYFEAFPRMIKRSGMETGFTFDGRNRRPPRDPVNAMLSLSYSLLVKDLAVTTRAVGFDPLLGFYHKPRYGRPSLALDLMEEFRPLIADSTVIGAINNGVVAFGDFVRTGVGVNLKPAARKAFIAAYERRMDQLIRHPVFGYQISYRRVLEVQARLLGRHLSGEIPDYPQFLTR